MGGHGERVNVSAPLPRVDVNAVVVEGVNGDDVAGDHRQRMALKAHLVWGERV